MNFRVVTYFSLFLSLAAVTGSFAQKKKGYQEDLSRWRPVQTPTVIEQPLQESDRAIVTATKTVNIRVDSVLDSLDAFNRSKMFLDGFTVQIYSGQKKQEALEANKILVESGMDLKAQVEFIQPKFRVVVGKYYTRIAAHRDLYRLRRLFPNAIIVPEKVPAK